MSQGIKGRTTTIIVVVTVVCLVATAPAVALTPEGTGGDADGDDGGSTLLPGSNSTATDDSNDDTESTDDGTSTDDGSSSDDTSGDTSDGASDESTTEDSERATETDDADGTDGTDDSTTESDADDVVTSVSESAETTETASDSYADGTVRSTEAIEMLESALGATGDSPDLEETANETMSTTTDTVSETTDTVDDLESTTDSVFSTLSPDGSLLEPEGTTTDASIDGQVDGDEPSSTREPRRSFVAASTTFPGTGPGGDVSPGPATGVALGVGVVAVGAATRQGLAMPGALTGLGSTLSAAVAPVVGHSSVLDRLVRAIAPFRYSRYDDSDPLEHEARSEVFEIVTATPGAYLSEVAERADLPLSTARHHVRVLEREDLLSGAKVRGKRRFYPAYTNGVELAAAMNDDATASVLDAIARLGAASVSDLADEIGRDPSTISHHLQRLEEDGIIVRERDGRAVMNKLAPEARTALAPESGEAEVVEAAEAMASD
jgi:predicted transcriptional regulator